MGMTALVVDDSMLIRHTVCRWLEQRGFAVQSACNGAEALQALSLGLPDLIITDLQMPRMTGPEFMAALKQQPETSRIPVVVLASRQSASEVPCEGAASFVIFKDIDVTSQLERAVSSALALSPHQAN